MVALLLSMIIDPGQIQSMDVPGKHTENGQAYVDEEVHAAAGEEEDAKGWDCRSVRGKCGGRQMGTQTY